MELQNVVGDKLDKNPPHTHEMTQINELSNTLDTKLDKNKKYNYSSILENPEAIDYLTTVQTTSLKIAPSQTNKGYIFNVDNIGDLRIINNSQVIGNYDVVNKKWIMGGIDVKDVLENHAAAITKISEGGVSTSDLTNIQNTVNEHTEQIANKADSSHTHTTSDITDYKAYDDTDIKADIKNNIQLTLLQSIQH